MYQQTSACALDLGDASHITCLYPAFLTTPDLDVLTSFCPTLQNHQYYIQINSSYHYVI